MLGFRKTWAWASAKPFILLLCLTALTACSMSVTLPQYGVTPETNAAIRQLPKANPRFGEVREPQRLRLACRNKELIPPDSLSYGAYIQQAFATEFQVGGVHQAKSPQKEIGGSIEKISFTDEQPFGSRGAWDLAVAFQSDSGKTAYVHVRREFEISFVGSTACQTAREMFLKVVQDLVVQATKSSEFRRVLSNDPK